MRLLVTAAVSLSLGLFVACADDQKPSDRAAKLTALKAKFDTQFEELRKRANATADPAERRGIITELKELAVITAQKALDLAKEDPKDATGLDASVFVIEQIGQFGGGKDFDAAVEIVTEHHLSSAKFKEILPRMGRVGPNGEKLLQAAAEKSTDNEVKAMALYYLGTIYAGQVEDEDDDKRINDLVGKATASFEKATKQSPDTKLGESTIAKEVQKQLDALKALTSLAVGKVIPDIVGTDLGGNAVKFSSYKGKVVLVDVWATWCGPCVRMIPHSRELVTKLKDKPFVLLSVSCDDEQKTLTDFLEKQPMPWDHWFDGRGGAVAKSLRVRAFPTLYLIDHAGVIRHKWVGNPGNEKLDKAVEELVEEAIKAKG
jgi:thiol-disulfide isomerase/thioredoxin